MEQPHFVWDDEAQAGYLYVKTTIANGEVAKTVHADARVLLDYDKGGQVIGVEVLSPFK